MLQVNLSLSFSTFGIQKIFCISEFDNEFNWLSKDWQVLELAEHLHLEGGTEGAGVGGRQDGIRPHDHRGERSRLLWQE